MSAVTRVIRQVAAGQVTGQVLKRKADEVVAASAVTTGKAPAPP